MLGGQRRTSACSTLNAFSYLTTPHRTAHSVQQARSRMWGSALEAVVLCIGAPGGSRDVLQASCGECLQLVSTPAASQTRSTTDHGHKNLMQIGTQDPAYAATRSRERGWRQGGQGTGKWRHLRDKGCAGTVVGPAVDKHAVEVGKVHFQGLVETIQGLSSNSAEIWDSNQGHIMTSTTRSSRIDDHTERHTSPNSFHTHTQL